MLPRRRQDKAIPPIRATANTSNEQRTSVEEPLEPETVWRLPRRLQEDDRVHPLRGRRGRTCHEDGRSRARDRFGHEHRADDDRSPEPPRSRSTARVGDARNEEVVSHAVAPAIGVVGGSRTAALRARHHQSHRRADPRDRGARPDVRPRRTGHEQPQKRGEERDGQGAEAVRKRATARPAFDVRHKPGDPGKRREEPRPRSRRIPESDPSRHEEHEPGRKVERRRGRRQAHIARQLARLRIGRTVGATTTRAAAAETNASSGATDCARRGQRANIAAVTCRFSHPASPRSLWPATAGAANHEDRRDAAPTTESYDRRVARCLGPIVSALAVLALAGCGSGAANKAGATASTTVLRLADSDNLDQPSVVPVEHFAAEVRKRSGGSLRVQIVFEAAGKSTPRVESKTIGMVRAGHYDLGVVGARAWDLSGDKSFRAIQAPFLIDSENLLDRVLASPIASSMLQSLSGQGLTGLGLVPEYLGTRSGSAARWPRSQTSAVRVSASCPRGRRQP